MASSSTAVLSQAQVTDLQQSGDYAIKSEAVTPKLGASFCFIHSYITLPQYSSLAPEARLPSIEVVKRERAGQEQNRVVGRTRAATDSFRYLAVAPTAQELRQALDSLFAFHAYSYGC